MLEKNRVVLVIKQLLKIAEKHNEDAELIEDAHKLIYQLGTYQYYKIRHIPTGLYYKPSTYRKKDNLSKKGKIYQTKPTLKYLGETYYHPVSRKDTIDKKYTIRPVVLEDWEIVTFSQIMHD